MDQLNRIERPEINPHSYDKLMSDKDARVYKVEKKFSSTVVLGKLDILT